MDKKTTAKNQPESKSAASAPKSATATQKNLHDIKQALEQIMSATAATSSRNASAGITDAANIARLHSFASDAYAHLLGMMAKAN
jgi:hypothetical protein